MAEPLFAPFFANGAEQKAGQNPQVAVVMNEVPRVVHPDKSQQLSAQKKRGSNQPGDILCHQYLVFLWADVFEQLRVVDDDRLVLPEQLQPAMYHLFRNLHQILLLWDHVVTAAPFIGVVPTRRVLRVRLEDIGAVGLVGFADRFQYPPDGRLIISVLRQHPGIIDDLPCKGQLFLDFPADNLVLGDVHCDFQTCLPALKFDQFILEQKMPFAVFVFTFPDSKLVGVEKLVVAEGTGLIASLQHLVAFSPPEVSAAHQLLSRWIQVVQLVAVRVADIDDIVGRLHNCANNLVFSPVVGGGEGNSGVGKPHLADLFRPLPKHRGVAFQPLG